MKSIQIPVIEGVADWWGPELRRDVEALYREIDAEIEATGAVCRARGLCCDFERAGHVLYASSLEIAHVRELHPRPFAAGSPLCPFWTEGLCGLRQRRPLGCRTYFCDERFRDRLEAIHETYCRRLKDLAERHRAPWIYVPFVEALRRAGEKA